VTGAPPEFLACKSRCGVYFFGSFKGGSLDRFDYTAHLSPAFCGIAFMAKASAPGRAKTRLVPPLTFDEAASLNTVFLQDVADNVLLAARNAAPGAGIAGYAAYGPPGSEAFFRRTLPRAIGLIGAWVPNFGECLYQTAREILARGHGSAVVLNADSPTLPTALLIETAAVLAKPGDRAVLGPSSDGGYYLLGLKTAHRRMFEDIDWSTDRVAAQTLDRAREINLEVHALPVWYDVDDIEALRRLRAELSGQDGIGPSGAYPIHYAAQTAKMLDRLWRKHDFDLAERVLQVDEARA
jgi:rSAM/selenodomain-associated transferase 1